MNTPAQIAQQIEDIWLAEWQEKLGVDATLSSVSQGKLHALRMELETGPQERGHGATSGSQPPSSIRVKKLEWHREETRTSARLIAETAVGVYRIYDHRKSPVPFLYQFYFADGTSKTCDTLEEAKAACQSDFQRRITECLDNIDSVEPIPHTVDTTGWRDISTAPEHTPHTRGVWIHHIPSGDRLYWQADTGTVCAGQFINRDGEDCGLAASDYTHWTPLPPPPGEEVGSDEVVFDDGFNPFMDGYDVDPDGPQNQVPPFRGSDIERGLILLRTSSNAHGYTNCVVLTDRIEKLPAKGRQELARMMRNIATEIDGPSPLQARCAELEAAAAKGQSAGRVLLGHIVAGMPDEQLEITELSPQWLKDCVADLNALRSLVDGGSDA